ncbi:unnamed protein product [Onchocerca flexuosa]|uniref:Ribosomal_L18_c domain-containing protein n=1 Tax=Onchocerca flexuosa TaxID=387005 RepID=A0A183HM88_9BILA|nr:unnamed protein product [Onchocerca flexuosa]
MVKGRTKNTFQSSEEEELIILALISLTKYASAYATGLLLARRHLLKIEDERAPSRAVLDVGLARTVTGAKVFAVVKGVADGGIDVPYSKTRFFGYNSETKYNAEAHRNRILEKHVTDYMTLLKEIDEDAQKQYF